MKNAIRKQNQIGDADYRIIGDALELKPATVKMIRLGYRSDIHNVKKAMALVVEHRQLSLAELRKKLIKLKVKKSTKKRTA